MATGKSFLKSSVVVWSAVLAALFIFAYQAVAVLGTKSNGTFHYITPKSAEKTQTDPSWPAVSPPGANP